MQFLRTFLVLFFWNFVSVTSKRNDPRIIGGEKCNYDKYPYAVAIFSNSICGGSLITFQWVLTAAHCLKQNFIIQGKTQLRTGFSSPHIQKRLAKFGIPHPKFDMEALKNPLQPELRYDIGLIYADKPFIKTVHLDLAPLPTPGFFDSSNCTTSTVAGIGYTQIPTDLDQTPTLKEVFNRTLMCVDLAVVTRQICLRTWPTSIVDSSIICTMEEKGGKDACSGDSGGPLVCKGRVIGVVSSGRSCALPGRAATYTNVEEYLTFISETMEKNGARKTAKNVWNAIFAAAWGAFAIWIHI